MWEIAGVSGLAAWLLGEVYVVSVAALNHFSFGDWCAPPTRSAGVAAELWSSPWRDTSDFSDFSYQSHFAET